MPLSDITDRESIIQAVEEFDEMGRDIFLKLYGFKKARSYYLKLKNNYYDSKAIVGVAHKYSSPNNHPLKSKDFSGGESAAVKVLKNLKFEVIRTSESKTRTIEFPFQAYSWIALSDKIFVKNTDKSCFLHHGTGIPFEFRKYLNIDNISSDRRIEAILNYNSNEYKAYFKMSKSQRTQLIWNADFSTILNSSFPKWSKAFTEGIKFEGEAPKIKLTKNTNVMLAFEVILIDAPLTIAKTQEASTERIDWTDNENNLIVKDYFQMLEKEIKSESYSKTEHRNALIQQLQTRSKGSIEFKHQNVSAVLAKMGLPYLQGYMPKFNIQIALVKVVEGYLDSSPEFENLLKETAQKETSITIEVDLDNVLLTPPELTNRIPADEALRRRFKSRKVDYARREFENRSLGEKGEEFVIKFEKHRLLKAGRKDLIDKIRHISKKDGDGAGFDILSFSGHGEKIYIEVKTTRSGKYTAFYMSSSEKDFLTQNVENYKLYRVFDFDKNCQLFMLSGSELLQCNFDVCQYIVSF